MVRAKKQAAADTVDRPWERSGRHTTKLDKLLRDRPRWHRLVGIGSLLFGAALFVVCESSLWGIHNFGGHIWYMVGLVLAASSIWWFGAFDPAE